MRILVAALLTPALLVACTDDGRPAPEAQGSITFEGGATLSVRVADDADERRRGLMGVTSLPDDEGMVFDFGDQPQSGEFWMKNTLIPLSIAFVDDGRRIVTILEMEPCDAEPCPTYRADDRYVLAIEANAGWFERHGVEVGDTIEETDGPIG
ncbi:MAG TPA: DUF192 domain-containing protein [Actinomycetota bacterium]|nr:DUF192 domain-containing protein [Actinomycetota bacterium]